MSTKAPARQKPAKKRAPAVRKEIDPRIRDRRVEVLRAQGRRRLRWMIGLIALGLVLVAGWFVIHSPLLDVERIRVTGTQQATAAEIRSAAGVHRGEAILFVDTGAVEHDVVFEGVDGAVHAAAGQTAKGAFQFAKEGIYTFFCSIPGHKEAGMKGTIHVTE